MSGKNLTFKLVMDADTKDYVSNTKQARDVTIKVFNTIKSESDKLKQASESASKEIDNIIPDDLGEKTSEASQAIQNLSDSANGLSDQSSNTGHEVSTLGEQLEAIKGGASKANNGLGDVSSELGNTANQAQDTQSALGGVSDGLDSTADNASAAADRLSDLTEGATDLGEVSNTTSNEVGDIIPSGSIELAGNLSKTLGDATNIIREAGDNAKSTANNFNDFGKVAEKALERLKQDLKEAEQRLEDFSNTNASPEDIETAQQQVDRLTQEVSDADTAFNEFQQEVDRANENLADTGNAAGLAQKGIDGAKFAVNALAGVMTALGIGLGINELAQAADSYTNLSARINIATREGGNFNQAMAGVHQVALMTNSSLDATGDLFTRINAISKDMGMSQQQALDLTKIVTQAIQIGGGSAEASEAAVQQFIQAMQGGVLRGEEFNSIMENGYGLAEALAKGLGVTTGELRKMAENGELSSERVIKAIQSQSASIQETYNQFPTTISNALQKIATSWQILIGEMDQANGASATVAQWLSTLADNMSLLKPIIDDIGQGLIRFGDYYSSIYDQATLDSLKIALVSIYNTIKSLFNTVLEVGEATNDLFSDALSAVLGFTDGLYPAGQQVSGFQKFIDLLNIAVGLLSDGFKSIGIVVNLFTGTLYGLASAWYELKSIFTWGDVKDQAIANMEAMRAKSQEYFDKGFDGIKNFESQTLSSIDNIKKSEEQKNQELIADNQKKLDELKAQESKHQSDYKAISDERLRLEQQLFDARKTGNQASIDLATKGLAELDAKEKAYQAESQKITDAKIESAQAIATAMIQSSDAAGIAQLKVLNAQLATQGLKAEFDSTGKVIVSAMDDGTKATENQSNATDKARKAAAALGLDLDASLNRVSEKFKEGETNVSNFVAGLEGLGVTGKQAGDVTYEAWLKWLETAKSQAEIDAAKAKFQEFGDQGKISTGQVESGLIAIKMQAQELPDDIDPVTESFKRLGIETKENLKLAAQRAVMDFINIRDSGKATAEGVQKAYEKMTGMVAASGDAGVIAAANAAGANQDLRIEVDSTGKASVKSMDDLISANKRVGDSARSAISGYRELGDAVRREAKSSIEAWNEMMDARSKAEKENKTQRVGADFTTYNVSDIQSKLSGMGYDEAEAAKIAKNILNQGLEIDKNKARDARARGDEYTAKAFEKLLNNGQTSAFGTKKVEELLARYMSGQGSAKTETKSAAVNALAPEVNVAVPTATVEQPSAKTVTYNLSIGGKTVEVSGDESSQVDMNAFMSELERLKKGM
jgi:tape measure domain-containing protein